jgi:hypothetical protein
MCDVKQLYRGLFQQKKPSPDKKKMSQFLAHLRCKTTVQRTFSTKKKPSQCRPTQTWLLPTICKQVCRGLLQKTKRTFFKKKLTMQAHIKLAPATQFQKSAPQYINKLNSNCVEDFGDVFFCRFKNSAGLIEAASTSIVW